ncbi:hypothetical protein NM208_g8292 [Fusarium decemcellulare]|uniref:Uncharacterized protein n=1 Tax=Fusarium decemcellulare TaxID=57161 RepID=A0ACC1S656_9HYPO|nr:hypothetical protein NM208_g8292 [Fusarium decemcellulare]
MASTNRGLKTYHVVPRFDIAAEGGELFLGAIFRDLKFLRPALNRANRVEVRDELKYPSVSQTGFRETRGKIRDGKFEAWVKVLSGADAGASASVSGSVDDENTVACDEIVTTYFDPDGQHLTESFAVEPIQLFLEGSYRWTAELYMITGLKVAKKLEYNRSNTSHGEAGAHVAGRDPHTGSGGGVNAHAGGENRHDLQFNVTDIVVGFRVTKYRCTRRLNLRRKDRRVRDDGVLKGEMMADGEAKAEEPQVEFEALPIPDEAGGQDEVVSTDVDERWVIPQV